MIYNYDILYERILYLFPRSYRMNNTDWKILIYLKEEKSINKVAKRLFMTQPSLTYRLGQMEKEIGIPLFIRTNKGVHFTDAGNRLYSYAEKELQQYQDMKNFVTNDPSDISGVLRIGAIQSFIQSHIPGILKGFINKYNGIDISLTNNISDNLIKSIKKEEIQLAIIRGPHQWQDFEIILENQPIYLISTIPITIDSLALQPAIRYNSDPTLEEVRIQWWKQNGIDDPPFVLDVNDCLTAVEIINAGLGYSIITEDMMKKCKLGLYTKKLYDKEGIPLTRTTKLICKSAMLGSGTISAFISFIKDYFHVDSPI